MTLSLGPTFEDVCNEVLLNLGRSIQGNHSSSVVDLVKSWVKQSHALLYREAEWIRLLMEQDIPLIEDQTVYDIPDDVDPARIQLVEAYKTDSEVPFELGWGIRPNERGSASTASSQPLRIEIINGGFRIVPAPSAEWLKLRLTYYAVEPTFANKTDRIVVDSTALILQATILGKNHYGQPGVELLQQNIGRHMENVRAGQPGDEDDIQLGGHQAASVTLSARLRNRISNGANRAHNNSDGWNPWP